MSISVGRMQQQQHHINQLLSTAAAGNGVVNDVDALLTPIQSAATTPPLAQRQDTRPERNLWRIDEIQQMLTIMQEFNALELLNDKTIKSEKVFRTIEQRMHKCGYRKKSHVQIWTKWKFLKSTYTTSRRSGTVPRMIPFPIYEMLHQMLSASVGASTGNSECGNSTASLDGDSSNGAAGVRMVISGVEGNYTNGKATEEEDDNAGGFGMAHPIFGFRLGMVKQEPADTGYETITDNGHNSSGNHNNSSSANEKDPLLDDSLPKAAICNSSTANIQFRTQIKQEVEEPPMSAPSLVSAPSPVPVPVAAAPVPVPAPRQLNKPIQLRLDRLPERVPPSPAAAAVTSTPLAAQVQTASRPSQLPPLRIAPFAKELSANAMHAGVERPPPPLSMHPIATSRVHRIQLNPNHTNNNNSNNNNMLPRKILPKPIAQTTITPIRLSREITVQTRGATAAAAAAATSHMPRLKHVPMRKTPYALRPERMIPDLEQSVSPPTTPYGAYQDGPSTSRQALSAAMLGNKPRPQAAAAAAGGGVSKLKMRKRRMEQASTSNNNNNSSGGPPMQKMRRLMLPHKAPQAHANHSDDDDEDDVAATQRESFKAAQQQPPPTRKPPPGISAKAASKDQEAYEQALKELGTSLRQMQREMITEFFQQQMELARKEHEFQMKQDVLIMQAFEEQTRNIMKTARDMLGLDMKDLTVGGESEAATLTPDNHKAESKVDKATAGAEAAAQTEAVNVPMECLAKAEETSETDVLQTPQEEEEEQQMAASTEQLMYEDDEEEQGEEEEGESSEHESNEAEDNDDNAEPATDDENSSTDGDEEEEDGEADGNGEDEELESRDEQQHLNEEDA